METEKLIEELEKAHKLKDDSFHNILKKVKHEPPTPLPPTLVRGGREIRAKAAIQKEWKRRYNLMSIEDSTVEEAEHRAHIIDLNRSRQENREYEEEHGKANYVLVDEIGTECYKHAIEKLLPNKAPADDEITNEIVKRGGKVMRTLLLCLYNILLEVEMIPKHWKIAIYVPVYKKGQRQDTNNYRPIGKTSVLYKIYERILDNRIRAVIGLPPEQAGFRAGFSTHTTLTRIDLIIEYCSERNIDLNLIATDSQEAFERAWRPGILHRLWQAGVKGKMWRIVSDLLTGTSAFVRTNYGDTTHFMTTQGVVQGSVLAALLFTLLVTPLSTDLKEASITLEGTRIAPQLYADDCTTPAIGEENTKEMLEMIVAWSRRWGLIVKSTKSAIMPVQSVKEKHLLKTLSIKGMLFKEKSSIKLLGLHIKGTATVSTLQAHQVMSQIAQRTRRQMLRLTSARTISVGVLMRIFNELAMSICAYSLPHARRAQRPSIIIQTQRTKLLLEYFGLPQNTPPGKLHADLGIPDIDTELAVLRLRTLHKVYNNREDPLTRNMLKWNLKPGNPHSSRLHEAQKLLSDLRMTISIASFLRNPYEMMKLSLKQSMVKENKRRWTAAIQGETYEQTRTRNIKPQWGLEAAVSEMSVKKVSTYLALRHRTVRAKMRDGKCTACNSDAPTTDHIIWECARTTRLRLELEDSIRSISPKAYDDIQALKKNPDDATDYLLGGGATSHAQQTWNRIQRITIEKLPLLVLMEGHTHSE